MPAVVRGRILRLEKVEALPTVVNPGILRLNFSITSRSTARTHWLVNVLVCTLLVLVNPENPMVGFYSLGTCCRRFRHEFLTEILCLIRLGILAKHRFLLPEGCSFSKVVPNPVSHGTMESDVTAW